MWCNTSFLVLLLAAINCNAQDYVGAVVEIGADYYNNTDLNELVQNMTRECIDKIRKYKNEIDIIVFPEYFLTTPRIFESDSLNLSSVATPVPDAKDKVAPCDLKLNDSNPVSLALHNFSCAARENSVYVVINLLESEVNKTNTSEVFVYNTNVVFDKSGTVIAKYHKYNLFGEPGVSTTKEPELVTFTTDFNVTFGTFICFDILFDAPSLKLLKERNVTDIAYTTAWYSETPFLTAVQVQAGWARANGVNLLAAGYHDTLQGSWGSGLYSAKTGMMVDISVFVYPLNYSSTTAMRLPVLATRVKENQNTTEYAVTSSVTNGTTYKMLNDNNFDKYNASALTGPVDNQVYCHGNFCCTFSVEYDSTTKVNNYKVVVYNGTRLYGTVQVNIQLCALVACVGDKCGELKFNYTIPNKFTKIQINGQFHNGDNTTQFPTTLLNKNLAPISYSKYQYNVTEKKGETDIAMTLTESQNDILAFGIYNTISKYTVEPSPNSSSVIASNIFALISLLIIKYIF